MVTEREAAFASTRLARGLTSGTRHLRPELSAQANKCAA
jgi:hypothetical protein